MSRRHQQFARRIAYPRAAPHRGPYYGSSSVRLNQRAHSDRSRSRRWIRFRSPANGRRGVLDESTATQARPRILGYAERVGRWHRTDTGPADPRLEIRAGRPREFATFPTPRSRHRQRHRRSCRRRDGEARTQSRDGGKGLARGEELDGGGNECARSTERHLSRTAPDRVDPRRLRDCARSGALS
jgi:hypothetical protein